MKRFRIYLIAALSMTFWGLSFVWTKIALGIFNPISLIFFRLLFSSILLLAVIRLLKYHGKVKKEHYPAFLLLAFFEPFLYFIGETFGLQLVSPTVSSIIISTIPVFTPFMAFWVLKERLSKFNIFGLLLSFLGVIVLIMRPDMQLASSPKGIALLFLAVASAMGYTVILKKLTGVYNSVLIITVQNIIGAIYFLPLLLIFDLTHVLNLKPTPESLYALGFLVVLASTLAFVFYATAVRGIGAARASIFANLIPVITAVFSFLMLKETIGLNKILGMCIVISGVMLAQSEKLSILRKNGKKLPCSS